MKAERELAKAKYFDFGIEDHGFPFLFGHFEYDRAGSSQGIGNILTMEFLMAFLEVFDVEQLHQVNGKSCWVTHTNDKILKIEPLHRKEGKPFDIESFTRRAQAKEQ